MDHLPIFLRVRGARAVVVGGGPVAARKAELLLRCGAEVRLIAPQLTQSTLELIAGARGCVKHEAASFEPRHLEGAALVVAATDAPEVNAAVAESARARAIPVNVVDDAEHSTFIFPAIVDRAPVVVAIGSQGAAPVLARRLRAQLEALLPARLGALARFAAARRAAVRQALPVRRRRAFWERVFAGRVSERVLAGDEPGAQADFARELAACRASERAAAGEVYLIGAGPGDADLLTLRALQLLQEADVILYDRLVSPAVLDRARREARRVFVGKEPAGSRTAQARIHELMAGYAVRGLKVARLKGGDPGIFGRAGEEIEFLRARGIAVTVVPGVTAGLAAAAAAAIPLTQRALAHSVTLAAGHSAGDDTHDWEALARARHTVVFYMGVAEMEQIVRRLLAAGAPPERPAAVVERATLPGEQILKGRLDEIAALARAAHVGAPALLIVGEVVAGARASAGALAPQALEGVA
ncbi:MAG TPA: siroheme synthase CysG [Steroidobacteraceae bacterium]|nr:siroheme synthase CysG [Steroidobacteraceae bacterium]